MTSLTDLREVVDVVIGVDTHVHTHTAAAVDVNTGAVLGEITVPAAADGYAELVGVRRPARRPAGLGNRGHRWSRRWPGSPPGRP